MAVEPICYVVPSLSRDESQHFAHLPGLLREVGRRVDTYVVVERSPGLPQLDGVRAVQVLTARSTLGRVFQLAAAAMRLRRVGCRRFFVRISPLAALTLALLQRPMQLVVYYWISGEAATDHPVELRRELPLRTRIWEPVARWLQREAVRRATWFVTGPERMRDYFIREYGVNPTKTIVLYNAIDLSKFRERQTIRCAEETRRDLGLQDEPIVLFVGRISYLKGGSYLPVIARTLKMRHSGALLVVVGPSYLPSVSRELRSYPNVRVVGAVPHDEVLDYYIASDLLIVPSVSEGFPHVLLEAMALGLPVVSFDVGGVRDILRGAYEEWIADRGDVAGLTSRMSTLLAWPEARERLRQEGFRIVEAYDCPRIAEMFVDRICHDRSSSDAS